MEKIFYTPVQVARLMGVRTETVYLLIRCGEMPAMRIGSRYKVLKEDFDKWIRFRVDKETDKRKVLYG